MGNTERMKLWYADIRTLEGWNGLKEAQMLLPFERREKIKRYKQRADALRSIGAGLLLEYGLNSYGRTGREVSFFYDENGKPKLSGCEGLFFNLAHSGNYAVAIFSETEVGVDIEEIKPGREKAAQRFLSEEEKEAFERKTGDSLLTKIWTRKESYVKAVGIGLRQPFYTFSVLKDYVRGTEEAETAENNYFLESFDCIPGYWLSVCERGKRPRGTPERIDLTRG